MNLIGSESVMRRTSASATTWESAGRSISRVPGMAIYISESSTGLPAAFVSMLRSVGVVHTAVIFLTVERVCPRRIITAPSAKKLSRMPCHLLILLGIPEKVPPDVHTALPGDPPDRNESHAQVFLRPVR